VVLAPSTRSLCSSSRLTLSLGPFFFPMDGSESGFFSSKTAGKVASRAKILSLKPSSSWNVSSIRSMMPWLSSAVTSILTRILSVEKRVFHWPCTGILQKPMEGWMMISITSFPLPISSSSACCLFLGRLISIKREAIVSSLFQG